MTPSPQPPSDAELTLWGRETLELEGRALAKATTRLGEPFARAVRAMLEAQGKVIVTGLGKSGHIARKLASTLSSTGTSAFFLHPTEGLHGDFGMIQPQDCLVAIAFGGETNEVLEVSRYARRVGIPVVAITGKLESTLARLAHIVVDGSVEREADPLGLAPTCSSTVALALGDALAVSLMRARGFTTGDFAALHPGGSLGRRLSLVRDHMHTGERLPKVAESTDFHEILAAVTRQNFGIVAVTSGDKLLGAISDGDLRRALLKSGGGALAMKAKDLMSREPKTTFDTTLAIDALTFMSNRQITQLFVVTREAPTQLVGIVRLHDLLAAKIL
jgi:arabinose-5-phosphate isomerase